MFLARLARPRSRPRAHLHHHERSRPYGASATPAAAAPRRARELGVVYNDWTKREVEDLYARPLLDLVHDAAKTHRMHHDATTGAAVHAAEHQKPGVSRDV